MLGRPETELRERLLVGSVEECAQTLAAYRSAGTQRIRLWPIQDELRHADRQLETFLEHVVPLVNSSSVEEHS